NVKLMADQKQYAPVAETKLNLHNQVELSLHNKFRLNLYN
ncbi:6093_t:CDS:1, partial [Racocetra fulgida]